MNDWQSWAAPGIVLITMVIFIVRAARRQKQQGCGGSCGCSHKPR